MSTVDRSAPPISGTPLAPAQEWVWSLSQLTPYGGAAFHQQFAWRLEGPLDVTALRRSVNEIVRRHGALRARLQVVAGRPVQVIEPVRTVELSTIDVSGLTDAQQAADIQWRIDESDARPFDLARGSLLEPSLLRLSAHEHLLLMRVHRTVFDEWSAAVFWRELTTLYGDFEAGRPSSLPDLPIQYEEFCEWQRLRLKEPAVQDQLEYWKQQLAGRPALIDLPADRPRPAVQSWRSGTLVRALPDDTAERLTALGEREGVGLFVTLLAGFLALLYRHTGQDDLVVASEVDGRTHEHAAELIGSFANGLAMRTSLSGNPTFRELLHRVRETTDAAYAHQDLPFEHLVREVEPERNTSHVPLSQVIFLLQDALERPLDGLGLLVTPVATRAQRTTCDLALTVVKEGRSLAGRWEFNADLFDTATVARMTGRFQMLLEGAVSNPNQTIATLPLLSAEERRQVVVDWNQTTIERAAETCLHQEFEAQVERTPDAIALDWGEGRLTYDALNRRANQLAHYLRALGVRPSVLVGICVERSWQTVTGILGVLKAGGAYVPLEPTHPPERLALQLENGRVPVLLTQARLAELLPRTSTHVLCLDSLWPSLDRQSEANLQSTATFDDLACVIYTSGSTGTPKGVMVPHKAVLNYVSWFRDEFGVNLGDRVLQFASMAFDTSVEEMFPTLTRGATLVLRTEDMLGSMSTFLQRCQEAAITVLDLPTAFWHELVGCISPDAPFPESIRLVIIGGERALGGPLAEWKLKARPHVRLTNTYGPTEATIAATYCDLAGTAVMASSAGEVPIGKPIPNVQTYVVDAHLQPVPIGVRGELLIGGMGVTRGYLNDPEATARKFVADSFGLDPMGRLYRTGDLVRYRPDGHLEFFGRADRQVKIRGYRVELGEVEATLTRHPAVRAGVVVAQDEVRGRHRLVAYVVARPDHTVAAEDLRDFLTGKLPAYMVPAAFVWLDALPLTSNGKVDRAALPAPHRPSPAPPAPRPAAVGCDEPELLEIWSEVLGIHPIRADDNFFALGGDSLHAARLIAEVGRLTGRTLPLVTLLQAPSVAQMSALLRDEAWSPILAPLVPIQPKGSKPPFFCIHQDSGSVLGYCTLARYLGEDQPLYGLQAVGLDGARRREAQIDQLARQYVDEICRIVPDGPYYLGGHSLGGVVAFEMAQQLQARGRGVALLVLFDTFNPAHLATIPKGSLFMHTAHRYLTQGVFHARNVLFGPQRLAYIRKKSRNAIMREDRFTDAAYVPSRYPGRITLFKAAVGTYDDYRDRRNGWGDLALDGVEVHDVPGDHALLLNEPHVQALARRLAVCLDAAQRRAGPQPAISVSLAGHLATALATFIGG